MILGVEAILTIVAKFDKNVKRSIHATISETKMSLSLASSLFLTRFTNICSISETLIFLFKYSSFVPSVGNKTTALTIRTPIFVCILEEMVGSQELSTSISSWNVNSGWFFT